MSRTTIAMVTGLIVLGCIVAWLPAQDLARRPVSSGRPAGQATSAPSEERLSLAPSTAFGDGGPPPLTPPSKSTDNMETGSSRISAGLRSAYSSGSQFTAGTGEQSSPATDDLTGDAENRQLHSVLKRSKISAVPEMPAAGAAPPSASSAPSTSRPGELPRRSTSNLSPSNIKPAQPEPPLGTTAGNSRSTQNTTIAGKSAALKVEIVGPQGLTVGKPAPYVVNLSNESDCIADEVQLRIALPAWVTVQGTQASIGEAAFQGDAQGAGRLLWNLPRVAARGRETLKLNLVTREGDAFDLAAEWTSKPAAARAAIIIKQPQLVLSLAGPADMTFGEEKAFTLSISNPGTADAEHVAVSVTAGNSPPQPFDAGTIPAGHKKEVPLAVVASQAGTIELSIAAAAEGGLEARTSGKINVRKAEVNLAIEGPPLKYAGSEAAYLVSVVNSGTAPAENIQLSLALPGGAKYVGGIDGATAAGGNLKWKIASLPPGGERTYDVRLQLTTPGMNRVAVQSQATASGTTSSTAETEVEAVSDLKLVVNDPSGPLPTGEPATYEVQLTNRGSQAAKQVKVVVQFAEGVEPVAFEGCEARIVPGQVVCQPLAQLGPGEQATLRIKAKAQQAGTHQFRVEVTTTDGQSRLVSEGTTRFFVEGGRGGAAATTARKPSLMPGPSVPTTVR